jgi:hypothetical protein
MECRDSPVKEYFSDLQKAMRVMTAEYRDLSPKNKTAFMNKLQSNGQFIEARAA